MGKRHHKYDYFSAFESLSELAVDEADLLIKAIEDFSTADALKETMAVSYTHLAESTLRRRPARSCFPRSSTIGSTPT